jgi:hypothetical protein
MPFKRVHDDVVMLAELEWHLLWPERMTMRLYVLTSLGAWHLQPRVGFGRMALTLA